MPTNSSSDLAGDLEKENVYKLLIEVFESGLLEADLSDSIDNMTKLYASFSSQGFESSFEDALMLILNESGRSKDVQKMCKFISDFIVSLDNKYKAECTKNKQHHESDNEEDDDDVNVHPFMKTLFQILINWSQASSYVIRFRSCQLLYMILTNILETGAGEIDINTYEKIAGIIQVRCKDVSANVRAHAVLLAKFFQDPSDHKDPLIAALCWQLQFDPNPRVRQNILEIIAACEETIIPVTERFLLDKNSLVRNAALLHICQRISPRSYTTQLRILILNKCFQDDSATVRRNAEQKLIPIWFRAYGDKLCVFFKNLRLENDCLEKLPFVKPLINQLFKLVKISQILEEIDIDTNTALPKSLSGEKIFIWHCFYSLACTQEKLKKFVPQPEALIEYIVKQFQRAAFDDGATCNELISFTMDAIDILGEEKCEKLPPLAIDIMKNPFLSRDIIPYAVSMYCEYAAKETKEIHNDLLQTVNELMQFVNITSEEAQKKFLIKCLDIFCETLAQDNISANVELMAIKDELVLTNTDSSDDDVKRVALRALSLYCLLDLQEARQFWPFIEKAIFEDGSDSVKLDMIKGALDIFKCYGCKIIGESSDDIVKEFEEVLTQLLLYSVENEIDIKIILKGMFKLYLSHYTHSPRLLSKLILLMFDPNECSVIKIIVANFLEQYGESSVEAECLTASFLNIINILFNAEKSSPYYQISIKSVALELLEFAKLYEENKNFEMQKKFRDLLVVKLTGKFIKKPWRISAVDLQEICSKIIPKENDLLLKLKGNMEFIVESLDSPSFQQRGAYSKKSINFFKSYLKKIETIINSMPEEEEEKENCSSQRLNSSADSSFLKQVEIEPASPDIQEHEISF